MTHRTQTAFLSVGRSFATFLVAIGLAGVGTEIAARAQDARFDGTWDMSAVVDSFTVQRWGKACGPTPVTGPSVAAGTATVHAEGNELVIQSGARTFRTDRCLDPLPTLAPVPASHSATATAWRASCATPPSDSRRASLNTAFFLVSPSSLTIAETGRYAFTVKGTQCVADVRREASLRRESPAATQPTAVAAASTESEPASSPQPGPQTRNECDAPGPPARLEVRPSRKLLRLGDAFVFRANVVDAVGCETDTPVRWGVEFSAPQPPAGGRPTIDGGGKLVVPADAPSGLSFDVVATAAGRSTHATIQVTSPADFDALLARSGLDPNGESAEPAVANLATSSLGTSDVQVDDGAKRRRLIFVAVIAGLTLALGVVAGLLGLRARKARLGEKIAREKHEERMLEFERQKRAREEQHAHEMRVHLESVAAAAAQKMAATTGTVAGARFCPSCHREYADATEFCPFDANRLITVAGHETVLSAPPGGVCPTCRRGFNPGVRTCPDHGEDLVPAALLAPQTAPRGKICPTCGDRFDGTATFCGKDGTQLVLLN